ncbi:MAG: Fe(3+) ABC transporter substrate-binding protein [Granulosicoccus sp.]
MFFSEKKYLNVALATALLTLAGSVYAVDEVNVYSYRQPFLTKPIFDAFTKESGIKVNTVFAKQGLVERLVNEGVNSPADLVITADIGRLDGALQAGVTQSVSSEVLESNIPAEFRDPDGHWFGLTNRARLIVTSKDRVADGEVMSYEDLAKPDFQGKICTRSGKHEYMVALIASVIAHAGEEAAEAWLTGVKDNLARKPEGNDRAQVKAISEGACDIAVINSYYMGAMLSDEEQSGWANSVNIVFPNQDDRGTHMNISGISLTRSAPNRDNAIELMEFLAGDLAQQMYAEQNHEYPVKTDVPASGLVKSWGEFKYDPLPLAEIATHRVNATKLVDKVGYDG